MRCLLVRHLPSWLSREEKESLFRHFGAQDVVIMPNREKMVCVHVKQNYRSYSTKITLFLI